MKTVPLSQIVENMPCGYGEEAGSKEIDLPVAKVSNIDASGNFHKEFELRSFTPAESNRLLCQSGDLLVVKSSGSKTNVLSGKTAVCNQEHNGHLVSSNFLLRLKPNKDIVDARYLWHFLNSPFSKAFVLRIVGTTTYPNLKWENYCNHPVPLPPLPEQKRIAAILDMAAAIRRKRQQAIKLADEFLRSVFLDMFGDPVTNPKGWRIEPFGKHVEELRYGSSVKCYTKKFRDSLPVLRIPNIASAKINFDNLAYAALSAKEISNLRLRQGDLLFVRTNGNPEYIGRCAVFQGSSDMLFASYLIRARLRKEGKLLPEYIQAVISMKSFRKVIIKSAKTTAGNYNINTQGLRSLSLPVAPLNYQSKYVELKKKLERLTAKGNLSDSSGLSLFASLSRRAFRGEL
jgi:type I restriction enzyme S subunit